MVKCANYWTGIYFLMTPWLCVYKEKCLKLIVFATHGLFGRPVLDNIDGAISTCVWFRLCARETEWMTMVPRWYVQEYTSSILQVIGFVKIPWSGAVIDERSGRTDWTKLTPNPFLIQGRMETHCIVTLKSNFHIYFGLHNVE